MTRDNADAYSFDFLEGKGLPAIFIMFPDGELYVQAEHVGLSVQDVCAEANKSTTDFYVAVREPSRKYQWLDEVEHVFFKFSWLCALPNAAPLVGFIFLAALRQYQQTGSSEGVRQVTDINRIYKAKVEG